MQAARSEELYMASTTVSPGMLPPASPPQTWSWMLAQHQSLPIAPSFRKGHRGRRKRVKTSQKHATDTPISSSQDTTTAAEWAELSGEVASMFCPPNSDDDSSEDEDENKEFDPLTLSPITLLEGLVDGSYVVDGPAATAAYWRAQAERAASEGTVGDLTSLAASRTASIASMLDGDNKHLTARLTNKGYFARMPNTASSSTLAPLVQATHALAEKGFPPVFSFVLDDMWAAVSAAFGVAEDVLGPDCVLEPSVFTFRLTRPASPATATAASSSRSESKDGDNPSPPATTSPIGAAFSVPHRDYPYQECFDDKGNPRLLNVWMPLNDVTVDNGCLYLLPREHDELFARPDHEDHLKPAVLSRRGLTMEMKLRVDLGAFRPMPCGAGTMLAWCGNLVHFGSKCV